MLNRAYVNRQGTVSLWTKARFKRHKAEFSQTAEPFAIVNGFVEIPWNTDRFFFW